LQQHFIYQVIVINFYCNRAVLCSMFSYFNNDKNEFEFEEANNFKVLDIKLLWLKNANSDCVKYVS